MKRIITLVVIILAMVNVAQSQSVHISAHAHTIGNSVYVHSHCYTTGLHNHFHRTYVPRTHYSSSYYSHYNSFYTPNDWNYYDTILRDISYRREIEFGNYIFYRYDWQTSKSTVYFKAKINRKDKVNFMANIESYKDTLKNKYYDIKNIEVVTKKNKSHVNLVITYISSEEKAIIKNNIRKNWEAKQRQSWEEKYQEKHKNELTLEEKIAQNLERKYKEKRVYIRFGDYEFRRSGNSDMETGEEILYTNLWFDADEAEALKAHIERNLKYYEEKYNAKIRVSMGNKHDWMGRDVRCFSICVTYNDWKEAWEKAQAEKVKAKQEAKQKRLESINW